MNAIVRPRAILFDWDNTLIDSWGVIHEALNHTLGHMGHPLWTRAETESRVRASLRDSFPTLFGDRSSEAEQVFYSAFSRLHLEHLEPLPGSAELLRELTAAGYYLGVVSNKRGNFLRLEAERLGWDRHFRQLAGAGDAARDKPCREHVESGPGRRTRCLVRRRRGYRHALRPQCRLPRDPGAQPTPGRRRVRRSRTRPALPRPRQPRSSPPPNLTRRTCANREAPVCD